MKAIAIVIVCVVLSLVAGSALMADIDPANMTGFECDLGPRVFNIFAVYLADGSLEYAKTDRDTIWFSYNSNILTQLIANQDSITLDGFAILNDQTSPNGLTPWYVTTFTGSKLIPAQTGWNYTLISPEGSSVWSYNTFRDGAYGQGFLDLPKGEYTWKLTGQRVQQATAVPETSSMIGFGMGLSSLLAYRKLRFHK